MPHFACSDEVAQLDDRRSGPVQQGAPVPAGGLAAHLDQADVPFRLISEVNCNGPVGGKRRIMSSCRRNQRASRSRGDAGALGLVVGEVLDDGATVQNPVHAQADVAEAGLAGVAGSSRPRRWRRWADRAIDGAQTWHRRGEAVQPQPGRAGPCAPAAGVTRRECSSPSCKHHNNGARVAGRMPPASIASLIRSPVCIAVRNSVHARAVAQVPAARAGARRREHRGRERRSPEPGP